MSNKILIVGLGSIGKRHLKILKIIKPKAKIAILSHKEKELHKASALETFYDIDKAISFQPDTALICNPSTLHLSIAKELLKNDIDLFIEKPLSNNMQEAMDFKILVNRSKVLVQVGYNLRFTKSMQLIKELLDKQKIGRILSFRSEVGSYLPDWRKTGDYRKQVSAKKELGGGVLLELSHEIDYLLWLFGKPAWLNANISKQSQLSIDVEDNVNLMLSFKKQNINGSLNMDFYRRDPTRNLTIIGTAGSIKWDGIKGIVSIFRPETDWNTLKTFENEINNSYEDQLLSFFNSIKEKKETLVTLDDGISTLKVIEAAKESNSLGKKVQL